MSDKRKNKITKVKLNVGKKPPKTKVKKENRTLDSYLPKNYSPEYGKHGIGVGYVVIPYRVFKFIEDNPSNWYEKINEYPYVGDEGFLYTLIYYIIEDGFVNIQELRDNGFYRLNIEVNNE